MKIIENYLEQHRFVFFFLLSCIVAGVLLLFRHSGLICDEVEHYNQILNFSKGDYHLLEISSMPGYHAAMALIFKITGLSSLFSARIINALFGFISIPVFYLLIKRIKGSPDWSRTLQFALFPPVFIYFFVIYTDILSLLLVMLMLLFALEKRFLIAGVFGILSMLIRQNNVIWLAFIPVMAYYESFGTNLSFNNLTGTLRRHWVFFLGMALFVAFVILNKGVAVGDASSHPAFKFSTGNLFFILFCFFIFFLPLHIGNCSKILIYLKGGKWPVLLSAALFLVYWFTFKNDHPYNNIGVGYFIRNHILVIATGSEFKRTLFFLPLLYTFWSLMVTPLSNKSYYLFYVFTLLFLLPSWLIEQRYYIIPFVLFMLFRKDQPLVVERVTILYYIVMLAILLPLVASMKIFL